jgi:hypothetical protein
MGELTNWLASTRLYLESERDFLLRQYGKASEELRSYVGATSEAFNTYPGYRFLYNLRDYAQHCGPPLSGMTVSRDPSGNTKIEMYLRRSELLVARFAWKPHAKELLKDWPEQISIMPLVEESMSGFRLIEEQVLRILLRRCGEATTRMKEGIARVGSSEGHPAVFQLPESEEGGNFGWQTFPEPTMLDKIDRAIARGDPLASLRTAPGAETAPSPQQRYANARAAAVIAARLEDDDGAQFAKCVNRVIREDQGVVPLISGLTNLSVTLVKMYGEAFGSPPQALLGLFSDEDHD